MITFNPANRAAAPVVVSLFAICVAKSGKAAAKQERATEFAPKPEAATGRQLSVVKVKTEV